MVRIHCWPLTKYFSQASPQISEAVWWYHPLQGLPVLVAQFGSLCSVSDRTINWYIVLKGWWLEAVVL